jgi:hypothetical protein
VIGMINGLRKRILVWYSNLCWKDRGLREGVGTQVYDHEPSATDGKVSINYTDFPSYIKTHPYIIGYKRI